MVNVAKKEELFAKFVEGVESNVNENLAGLDMAGFCAEGNADLVKDCVEKIRANVTSAVPFGYAIPKASLYVSSSGTDGKSISVISITLTNGWKDEKKFKFATQLPVRTSIVEEVKDFFFEAYKQLFMDILIAENLEDINALIAECTEKAGLNYKVVVVSPLGNDGKKVAYISDEEVDFVADINRIFDIDDILVLQAPDELITEEKIENAKQPLVDEFGLSQTTVQLVGAHGGSLIKYLCNIGTQVKAITLIRKVNNKNAQRLTGKKDTVAYYENGDVYAVVTRRDGAFDVLLKPFNVKTLVNEDVDVLAALK